MPNLNQLPDDSISAINDHLKTEFELDEADIAEMTVDYISNLERLIREVEASLANANAAALKKAGHSIKGVAGNLGSNSISFSGRFIEDNATQGFNPEIFKPALQSISRQYEKLKAENKQ